MIKLLYLGRFPVYRHWMLLVISYSQMCPTLDIFMVRLHIRTRIGGSHFSFWDMDCVCVSVCLCVPWDLLLQMLEIDVYVDTW